MTKSGNRIRQATQLKLVGRWCIYAILLVTSVLIWFRGISNGWALLNLREQVRDQETQFQEAESLTPSVRSALLLPPSVAVPFDAPPMERLLRALIQKPPGLAVRVEALSILAGNTESLASTRLVIQGSATLAARFLQNLERGDAGLLVTAVTVTPGTPEQGPTIWAVDGILP